MCSFVYYSDCGVAVLAPETRKWDTVYSSLKCIQMYVQEGEYSHVKFRTCTVSRPQS